MNRSRLRENIFKLLYLAQFCAPGELPEQTDLYFEEELPEASGEDRAYISGKLNAVLERVAEIDPVLNEISEGWKTSRMGRVDLAILRLAVYEMKYDEDVPVGVAINEAVELAKRFGREESASFVNGLLGRVARMDEEARHDG